eukprot:TRINITY_DN1814_c0_g1_i2.p1 TRINITY_DN1814_c0_g1~~TRINITY_DN1814_c0_g1_i2.p1  ORF type:complete len:284 (+),score=77.76 TRINITY_DN1814_c0_g1_i2:263-1114(+)
MSQLIIRSIRSRVVKQTLQRRWCTSTTEEKEFPNVHAMPDTLESPLSETVLEMHRKAERKWMDFAEKIKAAREEGEEARLAAIDEGLELSKELGMDLRRPGHEASLNLEAAEVYQARGDIDNACARSIAAEDAYKLDKDVGGMMDARSERAFLQAKLGQLQEAEDAFQSIVTWAQTDGRRGTPMAQSIAENLQHTARLGLAIAKTGLKQNEAAHELLGVVLPHFANENDVENTWTCLVTAEQCFRGMDDLVSAKKAVERQINWAKRFKLTDRLPEAEARLAGF